MTLLEGLNSDITSTVPGVDVVLPSTLDADAILDVRARKLVGALHRRLWNRRREMLQRRAQSATPTSTSVTRPISTTRQPVHVADMTAATWDERLAQLQLTIEAVEPGVASLDAEREFGVISVRGWTDTEPAVLVDGRAVPGCIFDVATAVAASADRFRDGGQPLIISMPEPHDDVEARLWDDLLALTEDRLGLDRGQVQAATSIVDTAAADQAEVA